MFDPHPLWQKPFRPKFGRLMPQPPRKIPRAGLFPSPNTRLETDEHAKIPSGIIILGPLPFPVPRGLFSAYCLQRARRRGGRRRRHGKRKLATIR